MNTYIVKIFRDGQHVDTQEVKVSKEDLARDAQSRIEQNSIKSAAMAQTKVPMRGALVSYEVTPTDA